MTKTLLRKYARLAVRTGANVQKGQYVVVRASVEMHEFAGMVVEEAYKAGAKEVRVDWRYSYTTKMAYRHQSLKTLCNVHDWQEAKQAFDCKTLPAYINIISDGPDALKGVNGEKMQKSSVATHKKLKKYIDEMDNNYQWTIVAAAGKDWAKKVFPGERTSTAVEKLWKTILSTVYIPDANSDPAKTPRETSFSGDPEKAWADHNADFMDKCARLNDAKFDYLEYKSANGTDFRCWLNNNILWLGGGETTKGVYYNPNMPTEEIFTTPIAGKCEGTLVSTKPLSVRGNLVENFTFTFEDGKVTKVTAEKGEDVLKQLIASDEGAKMLGELALVPHNSPISNSGILFYNTLFDENAACHVAIGRGFGNLVVGYEDMTREQLKEQGVNESMIHVDFMIGCADLSITGWKDGKATPIFTNGNWDEEFVK